MCSPASSKILYRNPRFLRVAFLQLRHQQQSGVFCDALLQAEGEAVPAHCCILSACSPFFTERLERERPVQGRKVVLELGGLKIRTLRKLVDFLYTSEMEVSQEEAQDVLSAARQLRVSELETLQLEGGKLVKAPQGRRLNRECLQPPSAAPISARVVAPSRRPRAPLPAPQTPGPLGAVRLKSLGEEEGPHKKSSLTTVDSLPETLLLKKKARVCSTQERSSSPSSQREGPKENKSNPALGPIAHCHPALYPSVDEQLLPRKIRLSRSKPSPHVCTSRPSGVLSGPSSVPTAPGRRLWRQRNVSRTAQTTDKQKPGDVSSLESTPDPSDVRKTGGGKKQSPESRALASSSVEEGQVGRVKLRKIVNGTCWEVVQEPPLRNTRDSPQVPGPSDVEEPSVTLLTSVSEQEIPARSQLCQDSPESPGLQDILFSASHSPDHPVVKSEFGSSPMLIGKEPVLNIDCSEPYTFDTALLGQPCEAEQYRITSAAATSELEEILDFMLCGSDVEPPVGSLESPGAEGCRTPSYHLSETGKNWIEGEEWCLPDIELWPRDLTGLEKELVVENKEPVEPLSPLAMPSENTESAEPLSPLVMPSEVNREALALKSSWTPDLDITSSQPLDGQGEKLLHLDSPDSSQRSYRDLSLPCSNWAETGLELSLGMDEVLYPAPKAVREVSANPELRDPCPGSSEDEEIDVVNWTEEERLGPGVPSVWPDPSSESETEIDILT
uniref:BTB/POZ domain-containing protein 18 n=1 Tax=Myodes glareolus TaxID=447135 RepID=UPI00201FD592|nr:BTB/POZ domain-containing protein 18 [Myodes glareolus]